MTNTLLLIKFFQIFQKYSLAESNNERETGVNEKSTRNAVHCNNRDDLLLDFENFNIFGGLFCVIY